MTWLVDDGSFGSTMIVHLFHPVLIMNSIYDLLSLMLCSLLRVNREDGGPQQ